MAILFIRSEKVEDIDFFIENYIISDCYVLKNKKNKERDTNILKMYYLGKSIKNIAESLSMVESTIKDVIKKMCLRYIMFFVIQRKAKH